MCGIAGLLTTPREARPERAGRRDGAVDLATAALAHRGPDGSGTRSWKAADGGEVRFGHRRLSILDLSEAGAQPWVDPVSGHAICYNGEVYNFRELREALLAAGGRPFRSGTDTEVILRAWEAWGEDSFARLRGIFAFAIRDARDGTVLLARDPLGVKPLYVATTGEGLLFASEVRALLASGLLPRRADPAGILSLLAHGSVQEPFTLVAGVASLPPGHLVRWDGRGRGEPRRFAGLDGGSPAPDGGDAPGPASLAALRDLLAEAVAGQLVSDVPLGVFLSGGLDSGSIAALAARAGGARLHTFTLGFDEPGYDEREPARAVARAIGSQHQETVFALADLPGLVAEAVDAFDQPSRDGINTWLVARAARSRGAKVALSGVGGDELLGGYSGYVKSRRFQAIERRLALLGPLRGLAGRVLRMVPAEHALQQVADLADTSLDPVMAGRVVLPRKLRRRLAPGATVVAPRDWMEPAFGPVLEEARGLDAINRVGLLEARTYMLSTLLRDTDQMGMAHGLEIRVPLLDPVLARTLLAWPGGWKVGGEGPKPLLVASLQGILPPSVLGLRKRCFDLPFDTWIRGPLRSSVEASLLDGDGLGIFDPLELRRLWESFLAGRLRWTRLWTVHVLLAWMRRHDVG